MQRHNECVMRRNTSDWVNPKWKIKDGEPRLFEHAQCNRIKRIYLRPQHSEVGGRNRISGFTDFKLPCSTCCTETCCDESDATLPKIAIGTSARCLPNASSSSSSKQWMIDMVFSTGKIKRSVYKGFESMYANFIVEMDIK